MEAFLVLVLALLGLAKGQYRPSIHSAGNWNDLVSDERGYERCVSGLRGCKCLPPDFPTVVDCREVGAEIIPQDLPPQVTTLALDGNKIRRLDGVLSMYSQLTTLSLKNNELTDLEEGLFFTLESLSLLDLSLNRISRLGPETFAGLTNLQELNLKGNNIDEIAGSAFATLTKLEFLDLSSNRLSALNPTIFQFNTNLQVVSLKANLFRDAPIDAVNQLEELAVLDLSDNTLNDLPSHSFTGNTALTELILRGCTLKYLDETAFSNLISLKILDVSNNDLSYIPGGSLKNLDHVEELYVGLNFIKEIKKSDLKPLINLKHFTMDGCHRDTSLTVYDDAFTFNTKLVSVNITKCPGLTKLSSGTFSLLPSLETLNFHGSGLERIDQAAADWTTLQWVDLSANNLICDCDLTFLSRLGKAVKRQGNKRNMPAVKCSSPPKYQNRLISRLDDLEATCSNDVTPDPEEGVGLEVILPCVTAGILLLFGAILTVYFCRRRDRRSTIAEECWVCGWTARRQRRLKKPANRVVKSEIKVSTLDVGDRAGYIDVKIPDECELDDSESENLYEVPVGPRSNYPDVKTTVL